MERVQKLERSSKKAREFVFNEGDSSGLTQETMTHEEIETFFSRPNSVQAKEYSGTYTTYAKIDTNTMFIF